MLATTPVNPACNSVVERSVKEGNKWQKTAVNQPSVISDYNQNMGGVDLSDQRVTTYARLMKGTVWYYKIFFYLLELSISNAQILMAKSFRNAPKMLEFRKAVEWENISFDGTKSRTSSPHPSFPFQPGSLPLPNFKQ